MTKITFLPHEKICPKGKTVEVSRGTSILEAALFNDIELEHVCGGVAACTTCHVIISKGFESLEEATDEEQDMLDKAWGLELESRLACQAKVQDVDLVVDIPKYTINLVSEHR
jgi:2Fe-2S ferredoxin